MAQFLRGRQAGIQNDLSAGLNPELFLLDTVARYGINSQVSALACDPIQSLLAVGTNETQFGNGQIYVFGQRRVSTILTLPRPSSVKILQFCARRLISVDSKNDLTIYNLEDTKREASYSPPGRITSITSDPTLDYVFVGLQNGEVIAYDMERQSLAQLRIPCLWRAGGPRTTIIPVVSLSLHPRDIGAIMIGYADGVAVYSFKQIKAIMFLQYELPPGAPGGLPDHSSVKGARRPKLVQATWHPTGTFILTCHDDGSIVIWDPKSGSIIQAMTLQRTNVNKPSGVDLASGSISQTLTPKAPISQVAWCCKKNPDDTGILIAGGLATNVTDKGLTFVELGPTPTYQTSSWQVLSEHFEKPKSRHLLKTPLGTDVVDFCLIPRSSPHHGGCCDPIAAIVALSSGEITLLSFPSGYPISPTNQLHPSLSFIDPFVCATALAPVGRTKWLGMAERRSQGPPIVKGGAGSTRQLMRFEDRHIFQTAHVDGTVRMWDTGHGDEIENEGMLQVDVARAIQRFESVDIVRMSLAGLTGEFSVGLGTGEMLVFRWGPNRNFGREGAPRAEISETLGLVNIQDRAASDLKEGFLPLTMLAKQGSPVTALQTSDIGFVAVGHRSGGIAVIDLRGPALILDANLSQYAAPPQRMSIRRSSHNAGQAKVEWPTAIEFGVLSLEGEDYSSIVMFVGSNAGRIYTFKILPTPQGTFSIHMAGSASLEDRILSVSPLNADTGKSAIATPSMVSGLRDGYRVNGVIVAVTVTGVRIFRPIAAKGAGKGWNEYFCDAAAVVSNLDDAIALVGLFGDGYARTFSIPGLKEIAAVKLSHLLDVRRFSDAIVAPTGDIFGWTGPSEVMVVNVWGAGQDKTLSDDRLTNPDLSIPPRPTISNMQWISGTQYFTPADLDVLVGGPDRPPSKRMLEQMRAEDRQRRDAARAGGGAVPMPDQADEGYWSYMQRQVQERTERLDIMGNSMDRLEETSAGWAEDVSKFVSQQKKKAVMGMIGSKFGF